ncbi:MAG: ABC transporter ATP-binding protein [Eubacteriaceae bacterium]
MLKVNNLHVFYGGIHALKGVHLEVAEGRVVTLIGANGAGKTTLVKLMVGAEKADGGCAEVLERKMPNLKALQNIGYMSQSDALYADLTGGENLAFFALLFKMARSRQKERIAYCAGVVELQNEMKKRVSAYSGGMKRRLALAAALIQDPEILILDEPTVGIDPELRAGIWRELKRLKDEEGKTIIITTHVMDEAEKCDYLAMIREGVLIESGSPDELVKQYGVDRLEDVFLKAGRDRK